MIKFVRINFRPRVTSSDLKCVKHAQVKRYIADSMAMNSSWSSAILINNQNENDNSIEYSEKEREENIIHKSSHHFNIVLPNDTNRVVLYLKLNSNFKKIIIAKELDILVLSIYLLIRDRYHIYNDVVLVLNDDTLFTTQNKMQKCAWRMSKTKTPSRQEITLDDCNCSCYFFFYLLLSSN